MRQVSLRFVVDAAGTAAEAAVVVAQVLVKHLALPLSLS